MTGDPILSEPPERVEPRGDFPDHDDEPPTRHGPHTAREALRFALERWYEWRKRHGQRD